MIHGTVKGKTHGKNTTKTHLDYLQNFYIKMLFANEKEEKLSGRCVPFQTNIQENGGSVIIWGSLQLQKLHDYFSNQWNHLYQRINYMSQSASAFGFYRKAKI